MCPTCLVWSLCCPSGCLQDAWSFSAPSIWSRIWHRCKCTPAVPIFATVCPGLCGRMQCTITSTHTRTRMFAATQAHHQLHQHRQARTHHLGRTEVTTSTNKPPPSTVPNTQCAVSRLSIYSMGWEPPEPKQGTAAWQQELQGMHWCTAGRPEDPRRAQVACRACPSVRHIVEAQQGQRQQKGQHVHSVHHDP